MRHKLIRTALGVSLAGLLLLTAAASNAQDAGAASGSVTFTVTAVGKKEGAPPIAKDDVQLFQGKERKQIGDWKKGEQLYLAILIDDSIETGAGGQWDYLKEFIMAQPPTTYIAVGLSAEQHARAWCRTSRRTMRWRRKRCGCRLGLGALGSSPYLATLDMLKRWPDTGPRRSIILITSGIDYFRGNSFGAFYPDLDSVIERAERQNTNIWSIYYPSSGHRGHSFFLVNYAQNNIDKLSEYTGAESYFLGIWLHRCRSSRTWMKSGPTSATNTC